MSALDRNQRLGVVLILLLAALARLYGLGDQSLWLDEAISAHDVAGQPTLVEAFEANQRFDTNPPLYNVGLHLWSQVSRHAFWLRLPSALFGVASVALAMFVLHEAGRPRTALIAGVLCAVSPFQIWYSQEARYYALLMMLTTLLFWLALAWRRRGGNAWLAGAVLTQILLVYTHVFGWLSVAAAFVMLAWLTNARQLGRWLAGLAVVVVAFLPMLPSLLAKSGAASEGIAGFGGGFDPLRLAYAVFVLGMGKGLGPTVMRLHEGDQLSAFLEHGATVIPALLALLILGGWGLWSAWRDHNLRPVLVPWLVVPLLGVVAASLLMRVALNDRYLAGMAPLLAILLALGLQSVRPRQLRLALVVVLIGVWTLSWGRVRMDPAYGKPDWRGVHAVLEQRAADDLVLATVDVPLRFYSRGTLDPMDVGGELTPTQQQAVHESAAAGGQVWLVYTRWWDFDHKGQVRQWLDNLADRRVEQDFHGVLLYRYVLPTQEPAREDDAAMDADPPR